MSLPAASAPEVFRHVVERLGAEAVHGRARLQVRPLTWEERPFSQIMRAALEPGGRFAWIKVFKPKPDDPGGERMRARVLHEFETLGRVDAALAGHDDLGVVRPLACYPELLTLVTEETAGETLLACLDQRAGWFPSEPAVAALEGVLRTAGRWICAFQATAGLAGDAEVHEIGDYVDVRLDRLTRLPLARFTAEDRRCVLDHVGRLGAHVAVGDRRAVMVHADLGLGNLLVSGRRVVALDFAMAHPGNRFQDLARLHLQLELLCAKPRYRPRVIRRLQAALLQGFDPGLRDDAPLFRLMLLQHRVNHLNTLAAKPGAFPASMYHARLRRMHRAWIQQELARGVAVGLA